MQSVPPPYEPAPVQPPPFQPAPVQPNPVQPPPFQPAPVPAQPPTRKKKKSCCCMFSLFMLILLLIGLGVVAYIEFGGSTWGQPDSPIKEEYKKIPDYFPPESKFSSNSRKTYSSMTLNSRYFQTSVYRDSYQLISDPSFSRLFSIDHSSRSKPCPHAFKRDYS